MMWTVAETRPVRERTAVEHLSRAGFPVFLPLLRERCVEPLFPSYIFIYIETSWHRINTTFGVKRLLTSCERPVAVADEIIAEIRRRENKAGFVRLPKLQFGDRVRITHGSFTDQFGLYQGVSGRDRAEILLCMLGQMVRIRLPSRHLQPVR